MDKLSRHRRRRRRRWSTRGNSIRSEATQQVSDMARRLQVNLDALNDHFGSRLATLWLPKRKSNMQARAAATSNSHTGRLDLSRVLTPSAAKQASAMNMDAGAVARSPGGRSKSAACAQDEPDDAAESCFMLAGVIIWPVVCVIRDWPAGSLAGRSDLA